MEPDGISEATASATFFFISFGGPGLVTNGVISISIIMTSFIAIAMDLQVGGTVVTVEAEWYSRLA